MACTNDGPNKGVGFVSFGDSNGLAFTVNIDGMGKCTSNLSP